MKPMKCQRKFKLKEKKKKKKKMTCIEKLQQLVKSSQAMSGAVPPHPFTRGGPSGLTLLCPLVPVLSIFPPTPSRPSRLHEKKLFGLKSPFRKTSFPSVQPKESSAHSASALWVTHPLGTQRQNCSHLDTAKSNQGLRCPDSSC